MLPNLIHPVPVVLELLDPTAQVVDDDAREPIHGARSTSTVTIEAQVAYPEDQMPVYEPGGVRLVSVGHILVRRVDMRELGIAPKRGDRVVRIGVGENALDVNLYITGFQPMAHYPDQGGPALMRYNFEDRDPTSSSSVPETTA